MRREARLRPPRALKWARLLPRRRLAGAAGVGAAEGAGALLWTRRNRLLRRAAGDKAGAVGVFGPGTVVTEAANKVLNAIEKR